MFDAPECRPWWQGHPKRKNLIERSQIDGTFDLRTGQQRLDFGGEQEAVAGLRIVQGPDAETVTGQEELPLGGIPDGKGPLPIEPFDTALALFLVEMEENFRV